MRRPLDLSGARAKFQWAIDDADELKTDVGLWADFDYDPPVTFRREYDPESKWIRWWVVSVKPVKQAWSLMLGNVLISFRASLDHLAWQLNSEGIGLGERQRRQIQFPVCWTNRREFLATVCSQRLPLVSRRVKETLSPFQPYESRRKDGNIPALGLLADLTRIDKHQELLLTLVRPDHYRWGSMNAKIVGHEVPPPGPFEPNTLAYGMQVDPTPGFQLDVDVEFNAAAHVALKGGPPVITLLDEIEKVVRDILRKFGGV